MRSLGNWLKEVHWRWLFWNVLVPTIGPPFFTLLVFLAWMTLDSKAHPAIASVLSDLTPWALCFFALTLVGASINEMGVALLAGHQLLGFGMASVGLAALGYAVLIALLRAMGTDVAHASVYWVTIVLWCSAVILGHRSYVVRLAQAAAPAAAPAPAKADPALGAGTRSGVQS